MLGATSLALAACVGEASPTPTLRPSASPGREPTAAPGTPTQTPSPMPIRQRIARMLVVGFRGMAVGDAPWLEAAIATGGLGGVILFDRDGRRQGPRNVDSPDQVARLVEDLRALAPDRELIVAIDQEGGHVARLDATHGFPPVASEAAIGEQGDAAVQAWADGIAATLSEAGINLNLAPVVDLDINPTNPAIGAIDRAFSADATIVATDAAIEIRAHRARRVRTALKHFPGLGSASANTDFGVADVTATWQPLELDPYRRLIADDLVDVVLAAHVVNGQIDPSAPASLSRATVTDLLRGELGFGGVVITDDLQAGAITDAFGFEDAITLAIEAGNDLLLFANQQVYEKGIVDDVVDHVEAHIAAGRLSAARIDDSVDRIQRLFPIRG